MQPGCIGWPPSGIQPMAALMSDAAAVGDRVLALRVIEQAIQDATAEPVMAGRARSQCRPVEREQAEARHFLFAPMGEWATARAHWCEAAGVSPEWLDGG
jgi:hypothetical protein